MRSRKMRDILLFYTLEIIFTFLAIGRFYRTTDRVLEVNFLLLNLIGLLKMNIPFARI